MKRKRDSVYSDTHKGTKEAKNVDDKEFQPLRQSFADLPSQIITTILLRLPIKSVLICKSVCTSWRTVISDPHFAKLHFESAPVEVLIRTDDPKCVSRTTHLLEFEPKNSESQNLASDSDSGHFCSCDDYPKPNCNSHKKLVAKFKLPFRDANMMLDEMLEAQNHGGRKRSYVACKPKDDKFAVVNSCNGLLCLCDPQNRNPLAVCNPITGEFIGLPKNSMVESWRDPFDRSFRFPYDCGFGFCEKTNEYKVVRLHNRYIPKQCRIWTYVEVHTLGTGLWRSVECVPYRLCGLKFPTYLEGSLHWLTSSLKKGSILSFNLESERFHSFPSPPLLFDNLGVKIIRNTSMGELEGFLYVYGPSFSGFADLWVMNDYGDGESWIKALTFDTNNCQRWTFGIFQPIKMFEGAGMLIYHSSNCFIYYDSREKKAKLFEVRGTEFPFEVIAHKPSLISLKDALKEDSVKVLNVNSRCAAFKLREEKDVLFLAEEKGKECTC